MIYQMVLHRPVELAHVTGNFKIEVSYNLVLREL